MDRRPRLFALNFGEVWKSYVDRRRPGRGQPMANGHLPGLSQSEPEALQLTLGSYLYQAQRW